MNCKSNEYTQLVARFLLPHLRFVFFTVASAIKTNDNLMTAKLVATEFIEIAQFIIDITKELFYLLFSLSAREFFFSLLSLSSHHS